MLHKFLYNSICGATITAICVGYVCALLPMEIVGF
jgi:hypothetical protein